MIKNCKKAKKKHNTFDPSDFPTVHCAFWPLCLSAIVAIEHHAYPLSDLLSRLLSLIFMINDELTEIFKVKGYTYYIHNTINTNTTVCICNICVFI